MNSHAPCFLLTTSLIAAVGTCAEYAICATTDVIERPAVVSARASESVLTDIVRTGRRWVAVGERGIVVFSDDGVSWKQAQVPVSATLAGVHFVTESKGWAVGHSGVVLHTQTGGVSWIKQLDGIKAANLMLESAKNHSVGRADQRAGSKLEEAQRWVSEGPDKPFFDVAFLDENRGFVVGAYGQFFATEDGGKTWLPWQSHIENSDGKHLYSISALGVSDLLIAGEGGALYRSVDAGQTFNALTTPYPGSYFGVIPLEKEGVLVYGLKGNAYRSHDGGRHWRKVNTGTSAALTAAQVLTDGSVVLVTQAGEVLRSTDGARSFRGVPVARPLPFSGVAQASGNELLLSGTRGITRVSIP